MAANESARDSQREQGQPKVEPVHNESGFKGDVGRIKNTLSGCALSDSVSGAPHWRRGSTFYLEYSASTEEELLPKRPSETLRKPLRKLEFRLGKAVVPGYNPDY